jgi:hypothetical protein
MVVGCFCGTTGAIGEVGWKLFAKKSHAAALGVDVSQALPVRRVGKGKHWITLNEQDD